MQSDTPFSSKFKFDRTAGVLKVKERHTIAVSFSSNILGEFNEVFRWVLKNTNDYLALTFKGNVIAPTFKFNVDAINFEKVS